DAAHGFGRGGEEVAAVLPAWFVGGADQPEVRLVDEGGGLKGLNWGLGGHPCGSELPQLVLDEREQVGGSGAITGRRGVQESRHLGHSASVTRTGSRGMGKWPRNCPLTHHRTFTGN